MNGVRRGVRPAAAQRPAGQGARGHMGPLCIDPSAGRGAGGELTPHSREDSYFCTRLEHRHLRDKIGPCPAHSSTTCSTWTWTCSVVQEIFRTESPAWLLCAEFAQTVRPAPRLPEARQKGLPLHHACAEPELVSVLLAKIPVRKPGRLKDLCRKGHLHRTRAVDLVKARVRCVRAAHHRPELASHKGIVKPQGKAAHACFRRGQSLCGGGGLQ